MYFTFRLTRCVAIVSAYRSGHVYESIVSESEAKWRHVTSPRSERPLPDFKYHSLTRPTPAPYADSTGQRKASTLPRQYQRGRISEGLKSAIDDIETGSTKYSSSQQKSLAQSSLDEPRALETTSAKGGADFETETTPRDLVSDVSWTNGDAVRPIREEVCGSVAGHSRRSRPSVVVPRRRTSLLAVGRRGKLVATRRGALWGRVPPVGAAATPVAKVDRLGCAVCVVGVDRRYGDSDEESYVTACNSTPLLSRAFPPGRADRCTQYPPENHRKNVLPHPAGGRARRRRLKSPTRRRLATVGVQPATLDHPVRQASYPKTTQVLIPLPVVVLVPCLYVLGGAVMFQQLYGVDDWSTATYVSLSAILTVGGWYPEFQTNDDYDVGRWTSWPPYARFVYALWVVVGLAILSASVRLFMQTLRATSCLSRCRKSGADFQR